jgi:hypothetical protein
MKLFVSLSAKVVNWWDAMTYEEQVEYLKIHPSSYKTINKKPTAKPTVEKKSIVEQKKERKSLGMAKVFKAQQDDVSQPKRIKDIMASPAVKAWESSLSDKEKHAVSYYTSEGYEQINSVLRTGKLADSDYFEDEDVEEEWGVRNKKDLLKMADLLESALRKSKLPKKMTVFRGLNLNTSVDGVLGKGLKDPAFMSTSTSASVASGFTSAKHGAILVMSLPKDSPAALVGADECEILLPRNTQVVPTKIEEMSDEDAPPKYIVHAEVIFAKN